MNIVSRDYRLLDYIHLDRKLGRKNLEMTPFGSYTIHDTKRTLVQIFHNLISAKYCISQIFVDKVKSILSSSKGSREIENNFMVSLIQFFIVSFFLILQILITSKRCVFKDI